MGSLLKLLLSVYIFSLICCVPVAAVRFFIDVGKWHDKEEKIMITPSQFKSDLEAVPDRDPDDECEVIEDV